MNGENSAENGADTAAETPRMGYRERLKGRYPDRQFETDEDYDTAFDEMNTGYDDLQKYKDDSVANSEIFANAMEDDPMLAEVMNDVHNGVDFRVAVAKHLSPEDLVILKEDGNYPAYEDAIKERNTRLDTKRGKEAEAANAMTMINEFADENFADDPEGREDFYGLVKAMALGNFTKDQLAMLNRGRTYEKDLANATQTAEMKGKNTAITTPPKAKGDGMPDIGSAGVVVDAGKTKKTDMFDEALNENKKRV